MAGQAQKKAQKAASTTGAFYFKLILLVNIVYFLWLGRYVCVCIYVCVCVYIVIYKYEGGIGRGSVYVCMCVCVCVCMCRRYVYTSAHPLLFSIHVYLYTLSLTHTQPPTLPMTPLRGTQLRHGGGLKGFYFLSSLFFIMLLPTMD